MRKWKRCVDWSFCLLCLKKIQGTNLAEANDVFTASTSFLRNVPEFKRTEKVLGKANIDALNLEADIRKNV